MEQFHPAFQPTNNQTTIKKKLYSLIEITTPRSQDGESSPVGFKSGWFAMPSKPMRLEGDHASIFCNRSTTDTLWASFPSLQLLLLLIVLRMVILPLLLLPSLLLEGRGSI